MSAKVEPFTFKDTGITVGIRKVSPLLLLKIRDRYPAPKPPLQEVDYGDGKKRLEPNPTHPDYLEAQQAYEQAMELRARTLLIQRGVVLEWTEENKAALQELKDYWQKENGEPFPVEDDLVAFVSYVAVGSDSDLTELIEALVKRSQPTEAAVQGAADRFPN